MSKTNKRIYALDEIRGVFYILMALYHLLYDLQFIFGVDVPLFVSVGMRLQPLIPLGFCIITGISCNLTRHNLLRGFKVFGCGLLVTAATYIFMPDMFVAFGVLSMLGVSLVIIGLLSHVLHDLPPLPTTIASAVFFVALYVLVYVLPTPVFITNSSYFESGALFLVGFPAPGFVSADYFPLLPWLFAVVFGHSLGRIILPKLPQWTYQKHSTPLTFLGKHGLIFYILHQPVIYGILHLIFML